MNESTVINSTIRDKKGKIAVKKLHRQGLIPSVVYGHNFDPMTLCVNASEINKMFKLGHESSEEYKLCKLLIDNKGAVQDCMVIVKEMQRHPVTNAIQHIDFFAVRMDEKITAPVHIHITGKAAGVKEGGILRQILREIEVKGLPTDIPPHFDVDVSELQIGDSIHVDDIKFPEKIEILMDPNAPIVNVLAPTVHVEEEKAEDEAEVEAVAEGTDAEKASTEKETKE